MHFRFLLALRLALLCIGVFICSANSQNLPYATSYFGNTWGNGATGSGGKWMQNNINGLWVKPDGTCYTNSFWDEGGNNGGIYKNGDLVGRLSFSHDNYEGGVAITGDTSRVYAGNWMNIYVFSFNGSVINQVATSSTATTDKSKSVKGLAADPNNNLLFVTQDLDNQVQVWNKSTMTMTRSWNLLGPGACAASGDGTVWVAQPATGTVFHFDTNGNLLPQQISGTAGFDPQGLCFDNSGRLVVADNGPDQNLKIYTNLGNALPTLAVTFGAQKGIFSGIPGAVGPLKFSGLTGVGVDIAGNYYVGQNNVGKWAFWNGGGSILESYAAGGTRNWILTGLEFVDGTSADPATENTNSLDVYTKYNHYTLDLSKTASGSEATWVGHTLNQFKYPQDQRYAHANDTYDYTGGTFVRTVAGKKILYVLDMQARRLLWYRFNAATDGEIAIPSGLLETNSFYNITYPNSPASGEFIWRDSTGNGQMDAGEYVSGRAPNLAYGWWVDARGDLWQCNNYAAGVGIRHWKMQGLDASGNPIYDYSAANYETFDRPAATHGDLKRIIYDVNTDTMLIASWNTSADRDVGNRLGLFPNWSKGNRTPTWDISIPVATAITTAGKYLFVGYGSLGDNSNSGRMNVYSLSDGSSVGSIHAGPEVINLSGALDIPYGISAYQRSNGEYLIFEEDDFHAKVIMFRWKNPNLMTDNLDDWSKLNGGSKSSGWTLDTSNSSLYFDGDLSRATRSSDTLQTLIYKYSGITNFTASVYSGINHPDPASLGATKFYTSPDGSAWTQTSVTNPSSGTNNGTWKLYNYIPASTLPTGTNYLRIDFGPGIGVSYDPQLAQLTIDYAGNANNGYTSGFVNDSSGSITYSGSSWNYFENNNAGDYLGDIHCATNNGDFYTWTFNGSAVSCISETKSDQGNVDIYIDDVYQSTVNTYSASTNPQQIVYSRTGLTAGTHTLKVVKVSGTCVRLDALVANAVYSISASASPSVGGTISGVGNYIAGTTASLAATSNTGYSFNAWLNSGSIASTQPGFSFPVTGNTSLTSSFQPSSFATWRSSVFAQNQLNSPTISGPLANPSGDGISNLLAYLYGLNPNVNNSQASTLPKFSTTTDGNARITWSSNKFASDLGVTVEVSNDLRTWYSGSAYTSGPVVLSDNGISQTLQSNSLLPLQNGWQFIRLRATGL